MIYPAKDTSSTLAPMVGSGRAAASDWNRPVCLNVDKQFSLQSEFLGQTPPLSPHPPQPITLHYCPPPLITLAHPKLSHSSLVLDLKPVSNGIIESRF
jgi:hypothetical protein